MNFDEFEESENIFLGAPIWWGELSWVINDFALSNDFTGKQSFHSLQLLHLISAFKI